MESKVLKMSAFSKAILIVLYSVFLGICFERFFFELIPGLSFPIFVGLCVAGLFVFTFLNGKKPEKQMIWLSLALVFFSVMVFVRDSELLTKLNIIGCLLLAILISRIAFSEKLKNFFVSDYIIAVFTPFLYIMPFFKVLTDILSLKLSENNKDTISRVIKGLFISLPILFIFFLLFASADLIFAKYFNEIFSVNFDMEVLMRIVAVIFVSCVFMGAFSYVFSKKEVKKEEVDIPSHKFGQIEIGIVLSLVNLLFLVFIIIQFAYLFSGEMNISEQDISYASYARRGFFELVIVAVFSFLLLWTTEKFVSKKENKHTILFKFLSTFLIAQVIVVMISSFMRLFLYESAYGFSTMRLYSHAFIVFLAVIFILLLLKIYVDKKESSFVFRSFITVVLFLGIMNFVNPDVFIAQQNLNRYYNNSKDLDVDYLTSLSADAVPVMVKGLSIGDESIRRQFANRLFWYNEKLKKNNKWQELNLSKMNAVNVLESNIDKVNEIRD